MTSTIWASPGALPLFRQGRRRTAGAGTAHSRYQAAVRLRRCRHSPAIIAQAGHRRRPDGRRLHDRWRDHLPCLSAAEALFAGNEPKGGEYRNTGGAPCYNIYGCGDGRFVTLGALEEPFWVRFCDLIGRPELKARQWPEGASAKPSSGCCGGVRAKAQRGMGALLAAADVPRVRLTASGSLR